MTVIKASTQKGAQMVANHKWFTGRTLSDIYGRWSNAKQKAYDWCFEQFSNDVNASDFKVGGANSSFFSASWRTFYEGETAIRYETYANSYIVLLDR